MVDLLFFCYVLKSLFGKGNKDIYGKLWWGRTIVLDFLL